ncbi:Tetratricopeptide repeat protein 9C [Mycena venus]|uniref:Tetratricopeptide repeat protein 9C n=1 Tax=Mycena venus TaxID=2733690 RepID=A0A8H6X9U5_9AGAR|nr:Tetratricopeptide repeat protein 9C [Mycena venus]
MADFTTTAEKVAIAKEKKETADQAFKEGKITEALMAYHGSLMYLLGLDKNALQGLGMGSPAPPPAASSSSTPTPADAKVKEKTEVDDIVEKIYANMSACHLKNKNWKRALETADKALAKNENNYKAMFRKAKALSEQGYFERSVKVLEDLKSKSPADAALAEAELTRLRAIDKERERANNKKLKGFLNKAEKKSDDKTEDVIEHIQSAKIEEVNDDGTPVASTSA